MLINLLCGICGAALGFLVMAFCKRSSYSDGWGDGWAAKENWEQICIALETEELERMYDRS